MTDFLCAGSAQPQGITLPAQCHVCHAGDSSQTPLGCHFAEQTLLAEAHCVISSKPLSDPPARSLALVLQPFPFPTTLGLWQASKTGSSIPEGECLSGLSDRGLNCSDAFQEVLSSPIKLSSLIFPDMPQLQFPLPAIFPFLRIWKEPFS